MAKTAKNEISRFEKGLKRIPGQRYSLRLYVTGMSPRSALAIRNITRICEEHLKDRFDLEVVDIYRHPEETRTDHVIVAPTLVKTSPLPLKRLLGDMTDTDKVLQALNLKP